MPCVGEEVTLQTSDNGIKCRAQWLVNGQVWQVGKCGSLACALLVFGILRRFKGVVVALSGCGVSEKSNTFWCMMVWKRVMACLVV